MNGSKARDLADHYVGDDPSGEALLRQILDGLAAAGVDPARPSLKDLIPVDQFHSGGLPATRELAALLDPKPGETVVDIGCGLGGPARWLAQEHGCTVIGVDLWPAFRHVATDLTKRTGLSDRVRIVAGSATDIPADSGGADGVWAQNVAMNIEDRGAYYAEVARVLRPGGRLVFADVVTTDGEAPLYPAPWARDESQSHLRTEAETRRLITEAGLEVTEIIVVPAHPIPATPSSRGKGGPDRPTSATLGLGLILGEAFPTMMANQQRNYAEGRLAKIHGKAIKR